MGLTPLKLRYVQPTSKGQVTLPVALRRQLDINPNTLLNVTVERGRVVLEPIRAESQEKEHWETVVDFTELQAGGIPLGDIQQSLKSWTKSKKR